MNKTTREVDVGLPWTSERPSPLSEEWPTERMVLEAFEWLVWKMGQDETKDKVREHCSVLVAVVYRYLDAHWNRENVSVSLDKRGQSA